ncbi:MAG: peptidoglycan-binding protein [Cellulomonas sp.]|nr:peptidoglycan-binding domain-containing protein [Cellulomonas sp.]MCR6649698.1 peptidoglycan-binding protein [Cellulomonas sp.]
MPSTTPVHLIEPALLPSGERLLIDAGDVTLEAVAGPGSGPMRTVVDGFPALVCDASMAFMVDTAGPSAMSTNVAVAAVVCKLGPSGLMPWEHTGPLRLSNDPPSAQVFGVSFDYPTLDEDLHAWVLWSDGTDVALICDGVIVDSGTGADVPESGFTYLRSTSGATLFRAAVWEEALSLEDAQALSVDLLAEFQDTSVPLGFTGSWAVSGTVQIVRGALYTPPSLPAPSKGGGRVPPEPPVPSPPTDDDPRVVVRYSEVMPAPTLSGGFPVDWVADETIREKFASLQIVVDGVDVTNWGDVRTPFPRWSRAEPFGAISAELTFPQITTFHALPSWCVDGAWVALRWRMFDGSPAVTAWSGVVAKFSHAEDSGVFTVSCQGPVLASDTQLRPPSFDPAPRDVGDVIAEVLNSAVSRRTLPCDPVVTGCPTTVAGGWEPRVTGYIGQLLATAIKDGQQWTVACDDRTPVIRLKDTETVSWEITNGQRGVSVDMLQDWTTATNVIYGEGIAPDGGRWRNAVYPGWHPDETPAYPGDVDHGFTVGTSDTSTTTGTGVSDWQRKAGQTVTGLFSQADRARAFEIQKAAGITQDGIVGPQTWAATFGTGTNTGTLDAFYMPLAWATEVMPRRYEADGTDVGENPHYDPDVIRVEEKLDYGQGVAKSDGKTGAQELLARSIRPGWSGTVTFRGVDPDGGSRFLIREGSNGVIRAFRGGFIQVHVARVEHSGEETVLTVDTNARDYPTLVAIRDRERNATDPAKALVKRLQKGSVTEARATFDAESPAGHYPRHAIFAGLWSVVPVPFGRYGSIVRSEITTDDNAAAFATAVFNQPVTAAQLVDLIGNPLTAADNPWDEHADELAEAGLVMAWGWKAQPCGYWPKSYSTPQEEGAAPITGRWVDDASWDYATDRSPWMWVATIASTGCWVSGRFWPGAD